MKKGKKFTIEAGEALERLDKVLTARDTTLSRSQWQKRVKDGEVLLNDKAVTPHIAVREGDTVTIAPGEPASAKKVTFTVPDIPIIAETDDYVVINKPAGVLTHAALGAGSGELLTLWFTKQYPKIKKVGEDKDRPGLVHRLDRDTSGVMLIAKTQQFYNHARAQFKEHTVSKKYVALLYGLLTNDSGSITFPVARGAHGRMVARPILQKKLYRPEQEGRDARTDWHVIKRHKHYTLIEAQPVTGRTHQIRVHFFASDHPVVGDPLYTYKGPEGKNDTPSRMMLHARELCFDTLAGERVCYAAPLPKEFNPYV